MPLSLRDFNPPNTLTVKEIQIFGLAPVHSIWNWIPCLTKRPHPPHGFLVLTLLTGIIFWKISLCNYSFGHYFPCRAWTLKTKEAEIAPEKGACKMTQSKPKVEFLAFGASLEFMEKWVSKVKWKNQAVEKWKEYAVCFFCMEDLTIYPWRVNWVKYSQPVRVGELLLMV